MPHLPVVLASTSVFRRQLLEKLNLPFNVASPDCEETPLEGESARELVVRLAELKARSCPLEHDAIIIGSDQVCVIDGNIIGKPLTEEKAVEQLLAQSGKAITFYTGLALHNSKTNQVHTSLDTFTVHFRQISPEMAQNYVKQEQPLWCAGSFKSEGLGIALFEKLEGKDPNSLIGLPLISLIDLLKKEGIEVI